MKEFCPLISDLFLFFSWHLWSISHFRSKFSKTKGGTLWWKKMKKNRFSCLIPQKNRLEKCSLEVKSVFENIYFWGTYGLKSSPAPLIHNFWQQYLVSYIKRNKYYKRKKKITYIHVCLQLITLCSTLRKDWKNLPQKY